MKYVKYNAVLIACLITGIIYGQKEELNKLSDEFSDKNTLSSWRFFHETEKFPNKIKEVNVNQSQPGCLYLEPVACGWYADYQAPFMYKELSGDFDVRTRIKVSGKSSDNSSQAWSLAGLMVRKPKLTTQVTWQPGQENWLFLTTGLMEDVRQPAFETKSTMNSRSNLRFHPAKGGWVELRIIHIGDDFLLLSRYENEKWEILRGFQRPDLSDSLQVGLNAYTGWNVLPASYKQDVRKYNETLPENVEGDLIVLSDYIRFGRSVVTKEDLKAAGIVSITDPGQNQQQLLSLLGD